MGSSSWQAPRSAAAARLATRTTILTGLEQPEVARRLRIGPLLFEAARSAVGVGLVEGGFQLGAARKRSGGKGQREDQAFHKCVPLVQMNRCYSATVPRAAVACVSAVSNAVTSETAIGLFISLAVLAVKRIDLAAVQPDVLERAVAQCAQ